MVRVSIHCTFENVVSSARPSLRPVCEALRRIITGLHRDVVEVTWARQRIASFGIGPKKMSEHYAYIAVYTSHVNLGFYHGAGLRGRASMLEGTGKKLRHLKLRDVPSTKDPAIAALLREAIADRRRHAREA